MEAFSRLPSQTILILGVLGGCAAFQLTKPAYTSNSARESQKLCKSVNATFASCR